MRRLLLLLVLAASTALALTPPASAGGPTSVIITDPVSGEATALYYTDDSYERLNTMLADGERLAEPPVLGSRSLNLTWLLHDVQPWQTQQLYPDAEGGPVVVTYGSETMGNAGDVTWSRPSESKALLQLADGLFSGTPNAAVAPPAPDPVVTEKVVTETAWWSLSGWRWLVPGLLLGAGGVLLATRRRSAEREPRQVLVDVSP